MAQLPMNFAHRGSINWRSTVVGCRHISGPPNGGWAYETIVEEIHGLRVSDYFRDHIELGQCNGSGQPDCETNRSERSGGSSRCHRTNRFRPPASVMESAGLG